MESFQPIYRVVKGDVLESGEMTIQDAKQRAVTLRPACSGFRFFNSDSEVGLAPVTFYANTIKYDNDLVKYDNDLDIFEDGDYDGEDSEDDAYDVDMDCGEASISFIFHKQACPGSVLALRIIDVVLKYATAKLVEHFEKPPWHLNAQTQAHYDMLAKRGIAKKEADLEEERAMQGIERDPLEPVDTFAPSAADYRMLVERALVKHPVRGVDVIASDKTNLRRYLKLVGSKDPAVRGEYDRILFPTKMAQEDVMRRFDINDTVMKRLSEDGPSEIRIIIFFAHLLLHRNIEIVLESLPGSAPPGDWAKTPRKLTIRRGNGPPGN